ncbi:hypothetical protein BD626DRAFT_504526 [Schizophyllum amplum]|uniref:DUF6699 domain-containing protein n=1 Tax=Schizophyllum amplum TaxID=97359 RepID=A0A550C783_9AGAR|nr:hypothetical protein BD626DRAFT_504526 [Auriculariopsis ampla]
MPNKYRLLEVSTHCKVTKMYIRCPVRGVLPSAEILVQRREGLRVIDVLEAVYNEYHRVLDAHEVAQVGEAYLETCRPWFLQRCRETPQIVERDQGIRRVDLMRSHRIFKGFKQEKDGNWRLMVESMASSTSPSPPIPGPGMYYPGHPGAYHHPPPRTMQDAHPMYRRH